MGTIRTLVAIRSATRRRGFSIVYVGVTMFAMLAVVSLAVDMGRLRVARVQLSTAADASALAGAQKVPSGYSDNLAGAQTAAVTVASENIAIQGTGNAVPVVLQAANDVEFGFYTGGVFTKQGTKLTGHTIAVNECNAAHVTARRTAARGTPVGLFFARAIGLDTMDVTSQAIAVVRGATRAGFGIVALDSFSMNGNTFTDSYDASIGQYGGTNVHWYGSVASNGPISMVGTSDIYGDAHPGPGQWVSQNGNTLVHGWISPLESPMVYPPPTLPAGIGARTTIDALTTTGSGKSKKTGQPIPGGADAAHAISYWVDEIGSGFSTTGYVNLYVDGDIGYTGGQNTTAPMPAMITIYGLGTTSNSLDIGGGSGMYAHLYAPTYAAKFHGTGHSGGFFGWIVCKSMDLKGNSPIHYDESLPNPDGPRRGALVK